MSIVRGQCPVRADFVVETNGYIFIIECKNSLGFRTPLSKSGDPQKNLLPLLQSWGRIAGSFRQCLVTKQTLTSAEIKGKKVFTLIVANETVLGEAAAFPGFYEQNIFKELGLKYGAMSIISVAQFENLIASGKLEEFAKECENNAKPNYSPDYIEFLQVKEVLNLGFEPHARDLSFWHQEKFDIIEELS
jgi:hypothetical protein